MGNRDREDIETEESVTVSGYGAMTVNNDPPSLPAGFPQDWRRLGFETIFAKVGINR